MKNEEECISDKIKLDTKSYDIICPMEFAMTQISGKWKLIILWHIYQNKVIRYGELKRSVSKITDKMLSNQLKELVRDQIIHKQVYQEIPLKVEYSLTAYGESLIPIMKMLYRWGEEYISKVHNSSGEECEESSYKIMTM